MADFSIGVILESFKLPRTTAIEHAAKLGADGIQMYVTEGENAPENLDAAARKALKKQVNDAGMVFSALCGDLGMGFGNPELNPELVRKSKLMIDLANDLGTNIVTTHIGVVPADKNHERYKIMQAACFELAEYAKSRNSHFAVETGPEPPEVLCGFLDTLGSDGVAVNLDPANLRMVLDIDSVHAVEVLSKYIVHTHAKDGVHLLDCNPEYVYRAVHPIPPEFDGVKYFEEVPLGEGKVNFDTYLKALNKNGFNGFLTIEREVGSNPEKDIAHAIEFLREKISRI